MQKKQEAMHGVFRHGFLLLFVLVIVFYMFKTNLFEDLIN